MKQTNENKIKINKKKPSSLISSGLYLVDLDHTRITLLIKRIIDLIHQKKSIHLIKRLAKCLESALNLHFLHEETIMKSVNYPKIKNHRVIHMEALENYRNFTYAINKYSCFKNLEDRFTRILTWLEFHILHEDMQFKPFVTKNKTAEKISQNFYLKMQNNNEMNQINKICSAINKRKK